MNAEKLKVFAVALGVAFLTGCDLGMHWLAANEEDRVVKVESGDRLYLKLVEDPADGQPWRVVSDDPDVELKVEHDNGEAKVEIRVHRGYDGPSTVTFRRRMMKGERPREFVISLYKRTGDAAFWKD